MLGISMKGKVKFQTLPCPLEPNISEFEVLIDSAAYLRKPFMQMACETTQDCGLQSLFK